MSAEEQEQIGWAIVELMGHVRLAGRVSEEEHFGAKLGRLDIPMAGGGFTTQFFGGSSVYRLTPVTEEIARAVAERNQPEPVSRWELPAPKITVSRDYNRNPGTVPYDEAGHVPSDGYGDDDDDDDEQRPAYTY